MVSGRYYNIIIDAFDEAGLDHGEYASYYVTEHLKKSTVIKNVLEADVKKMQAFADFQDHAAKTRDEFSKVMNETWEDLHVSFSDLAVSQARQFVAGEKNSEDEDDSGIEDCNSDDDCSTDRDSSSSDGEN